MPATLRSLLAERSFQLRLVTGAAGDDPVLDEPLLWAHNSDLVDPTPWLEAGQLLLTDGLQFVDDSSPERADPYVARLIGRGVRALGFATEVIHDRIPPALIEACRTRGLPLLEVAERTPFISIIRFVADVISAEQRERLEWSLRAQRAVAWAALRPDGLGAILLELEKQLDCWVALYDSTGGRIHVRTRISMPADAEAIVGEAVQTVLSRGSRAGARISVGNAGVTLQTLGQRGRLRGVLVVGTPTPLDPAGSDLVASVIGLASIALEQSRTVDTARRHLRAGLLELLLSGVIDVAGRTARRLWGRLPAEPVRLVVLARPLPGLSLLDELELYAQQNRGRLFYAERDDEIVVVTRHDDTEPLELILRRHEMAAGISSPVPWSRLSTALTEARKAAARCTRGRPVVRFELLTDGGMLGLLEAAGAESVARRVLQPLLDRERPEREALLTTVTAWLEHNCAWDPTAKALGIHRHTLRNRVRAVEEILGIDLEQFASRAELWAALHFLRES